jgi:diacylglycerol O-acyltransferase / wax synthase
MTPTPADDHLSALDATFLELEEVDRNAHMHIGGVMVFDPSPDGRVGAPAVELVRAEIATRLADLPRFRQRLSEPRTGGVRWPRWIADENFDIAHHVERVELPGPAESEVLRSWAGHFYSRPLDRSRPLWELALLDLAGGGWAMATKTHHCMVDGVGSVEIGHTILDVEPLARPRRGREPRGGLSGGGEQTPSRAADEATGPRRLLDVPRGLGSSAASLAGAGLAATRRLLGLARSGTRLATHPAQLRDTASQAKAMVELLIRDELVPAPPASINVTIGPERRLGVVEASLAEVKMVKEALGGTVNDVVLAVTAGALRELLLARGDSLPEQGLRAMVPVNLRQASDQLGAGNRISSLFVHLPVAEADPLRRYFRQLEEAESLKAGSQAEGSRGLIDLTSAAPPLAHAFLARSLYATRLFNLTITNVPGPQQPLYAFGSRMREVWPLVPLASEHAIALAVVSYDGRMFFCFNADRAAVPELEVVEEGLREEIAELTDLAHRRVGGNG